MNLKPHNFLKVHDWAQVKVVQQNFVVPVCCTFWIWQTTIYFIMYAGIIADIDDESVRWPKAHFQF